MLGGHSFVRFMASMEQNVVTLGAGLLDRAAECRADLATLRGSLEAKWIAIWRGRVPVRTDGTLLMETGADVVAPEEASVVFVGRLDDGAPILAYDVSARPEVEETMAASAPWAAEPTVCEGLPEHAFYDLRAIMTRLSPLEAEIAATARALFDWHRSHRYCAKCGQPSQMAEAGWRRDCPSCQAAHFPRTDPVVIMLVTHGNDVLMGRNAEWPPGFYSILAGFVEPGEPIEAAVRREVFEEAGVRIGDVDYVASQPWPFPTSLMFGCRATALSREITIDPKEIEDARWVSREDMMRVFAGQHPEIGAPRKGAIAHFLLRKWLEDRFV